MNNKEDLTTKYHQKFAVECFNKTWSLLDKEKRTEEDNLEMIHTAHASRFHWGIVGKPIHLERGEWQISRVYAVLKYGKQALFHAKKCLAICHQEEIADFDIAFAYEAIARAYAILGDGEKKEKFLALAKEAGDQISKKEDRDYFFSELKSIQ
jgi:hypothetical protein